MTKQPKAVKAWAVWSNVLQDFKFDVFGQAEVYASRNSAVAAVESWYGHECVVKRVRVTPIVPKKRRSKK